MPDLPHTISFLPRSRLLNSVLALLQALTNISPSLASMVKFHEPEFAKFESHSVEWHNRVAGLGATGLSISPCLVRMGAVGAGTLHTHMLADADHA